MESRCYYDFHKGYRIVACDLRGGIGYRGGLPWFVPEETRFFREQTLYSTMIMGHKTYRSLPKHLSNNRASIVLTRSKRKSSFSNLFHAQGILECLQLAKQIENEKVFVIGGADIYDLFLSEENFTVFRYNFIEK